MITPFLLWLLSSSLYAQDTETRDWTETRDKWGQLLFCQRIYTLPEVKPRLYDFDFEQCKTAGELLQSAISTYSEQSQALLKKQAEQHAYRISYNTNEPYHSVGACREYCKELAGQMEKNNE